MLFAGDLDPQAGLADARFGAGDLELVGGCHQEKEWGASLVTRCRESAWLRVVVGMRT